MFKPVHWAVAALCCLPGLLWAAPEVECAQMQASQQKALDKPATRVDPIAGRMDIRKQGSRDKRREKAKRIIGRAQQRAADLSESLMVDYNDPGFNEAWASGELERSKKDQPAQVQPVLSRPVHGRCLTVPVLQRQYSGVKNAVESLAVALDELKRDDPLLADVMGLKAQQLDTLNAMRVAATQLASRSAQYGFYIGPSFSQNADGSWKAGTEVLARFDPEAGTPEDSATCFYPFAWCRAYSEFSYQVIGAVEDAAGAAVEETAGFNPFTESGGYFRFNGGVRGHFSDWFGLQAGVGLSSLPNREAAEHRLVPRYFAGLDFQTIYGDGAMGQLFIGYAHDEFWERRTETQTLREFGRYVVNGTFLLPGVEAVGFRIAARAALDAPVSGDGPSETRLAILFYQDFSGWLDLFNPLKALAAE